MSKKVMTFNPTENVGMEPCNDWGSFVKIEDFEELNQYTKVIEATLSLALSYFGAVVSEDLEMTGEDFNKLYERIKLEREKRPYE